MKAKINLRRLILLFVVTLINSCDIEVKISPKITTTTISSITTTTATGGGDITSDGGSTVTARGVCWSTSQYPTISNNKTSDGSGAGVFTSSITGLTASTTYYVRAYATNSIGTSYGEQNSFNTTTIKTAPAINTTAVSSIETTTATGGGNITSDGGSAVTARGVCWSTAQSPTISNNKTSDGSGTGVFTSSITGLTANTTYFVKSYATNSIGTSYGEQVSFNTTTIKTAPVITTTAISSIAQTTATGGGDITSDGGSTVTARGVCWSTSQYPTISNNKTSDGSGAGVFTSSITGLTASTTYYVRAYATNSIGTSYGAKISFKTIDPLPSSGSILYNGKYYPYITIGNQTWMTQNLATTKYNNGTNIPYVSNASTWLNLTTPAYSYYNNDATNKNTYGNLYNWYAVNTGLLAPPGWHVATKAEWETLVSYVKDHIYPSISTAAALASTTKWKSSTSAGTIGYSLSTNNSSGFTALPGGLICDAVYGTYGFNFIQEFGGWWTATQNGNLNALGFTLIYNSSSTNYFTNYYKYDGASVRCVRD